MAFLKSITFLIHTILQDSPLSWNIILLHVCKIFDKRQRNNKDRRISLSCRFQKNFLH